MSALFCCFFGGRGVCKEAIQIFYKMYISLWEDLQISISFERYKHCKVLSEGKKACIKECTQILMRCTYHYEKVTTDLYEVYRFYEEICWSVWEGIQIWMTSFMQCFCENVRMDKWPLVNWVLMSKSALSINTDEQG